MEATQVTTAELPGLLKMMWEKSLLAKHLQSGFKCPGLYPRSKTAVLNTKLSGPQCTQHHIRPHLMALRPHLWDHFAQLLVAKTQQTSTAKQSKRIRPDCYGQALTSDQVMMIEQKEKEKLSMQCIACNNLACDGYNACIGWTSFSVS